MGMPWNLSESPEGHGCFVEGRADKKEGKALTWLGEQKPARFLKNCEVIFIDLLMLRVNNYHSIIRTKRMKCILFL